MPVAILKFKLPEEQGEFDLALKAGEMSSQLWDISNVMREYRKYREMSEAESKFFSELDDRVMACFRDEG